MFKGVASKKANVFFIVVLFISFFLFVTFVSAQVSCGNAICQGTEQCLGGQCTDILNSIQQVLNNNTLSTAEALLSIGQFLQTYFASPPPCTSDTHCQTGFICELGSCVSQLADGSSCTTDRECLSLSCVNSLCGVPLPPPPPTTLCATSPLCPGSFFPLTQNEATGRGGNALLSERVEYWNTDSIGTFFLIYSKAESQNLLPQRLQINLSLWNGNNLLHNLSVLNVTDYKLELVVDMPQLSAGDYLLKAEVIDKNKGTVLYTLDVPFTKVDKNAVFSSFPSNGVPMQVHALNDGQSIAWPISTGVPLPRGALDDITSLALLEDGQIIPAQFIMRATWERSGGIKWVGVDFTARYTNGQPRSYQLVQRPATVARPSTPLTYSQNATDIIVDTGLSQFQINRQQFAGIEKTWFDTNNDNLYQDNELVINEQGGPFVVDEFGDVYTAVQDTQSVVAVEEAGPVRVTVVAKGWYVNSNGDKFNQFSTRISFFADQSYALISHRTIITYDTRFGKKLADAAWEFTPQDVGNVLFGVDGTAQQITAPTGGDSLYLSQEKSNSVRLSTESQDLVSGSRADGWVTVQGTQTGATVFLRDIFQKYPKELELNNDPNSPHVLSGNPWKAKLVVHLWPKHGRPVFNDNEEISRGNIYKIRYAHEGPLLDFTIPSTYLHELWQWQNTTNKSASSDWNWDLESQMEAAEAGNAQGVAIGNEFLFFPSAIVNGVDLREIKSVFQQGPHALADPAWNAGAKIDGIFSERDPAFFPAAEKQLDLAYPRYYDYVINQTDEFGMWVYGDIHNSWDQQRELAELHRVWQSSHYQNVWGSWFLYLRSGLPEMYEWARVNSDHFRDVDTVNYERQWNLKPNQITNFTSPPGTIMHVKGFLPWAGEQSFGFHGTDMNNYLLRYYLTGDRHSLDMVQQWGKTSVELLTSNTILTNVSTDCQDASTVTLRNTFPVLAESVAYYEATWDPQFIQKINLVARSLDRPFECTIVPKIHPVIHANWIHRYYDLARDPRVLERLFAWNNAGNNNLVANAFLYEQTKNVTYLEKMMPDFYDRAYDFYDNPADPLHGFTQRVAVSSSTIWLKEAPYFLQALKNAGLQPQRGIDVIMYPAIRTSLPAPKKVTIAANSRGWSDSALITLLAPQGNIISIDTEMFGTFGRCYALHNFTTDIHFAEMNLSGSNTTVRKDIVTNPNNPLYRFECKGSGSLAAPIASGMPEVSVLTRTKYNSNESAIYFTGISGNNLRQLFYMRPLDLTKTVELRFEIDTPGIFRTFSKPVYVHLQDANGNIIVETSLLAYHALRPKVDVIIDPSQHPAPWLLYSSTSYPFKMQLVNGSDELFFATDPASFDQVLPLLPLN